MPIAFAVAAKAHGLAEDEDVVEVPIDGEVYQARRPTTMQAALLTTAQYGTVGEQIEAIMSLLRGLLGDAAYRHIQKLIWERRLDIGDLFGGSDQNPEGGLVEQIFEAFQGEEHPSQPSSASASSRASSGRRSTGRSPGKGSTHSTSPSTDS